MISWLTAAILAAALFGLNIGSFLNVVIWRLPRGGSLSHPTWSYCPRCEHRLGALDLVPVLSFLALRARCRHCRGPISWRYPAIEMLTGLLFAAIAWRFSGAQDTIAALDIGFNCLFVATLICVFFIDLEHFVIPDGLSILGLLIGLAHWALVGPLKNPPHSFRESLTGALSYAGLIYGVGLIAYIVIVGIGNRRGAWRSGWVYLQEVVMDWAYIAVHYASKVIPPLRRYVEPPPPLEGYTAEEIEADEDEGGMGGGDGKLAASLGANLLGTNLFCPLWLQAFLYAIILGCLQSIIILMVTGRRLGERTAIPFGPAMAGGALIALFFGQAIGAWYFQHFWSFNGSPFAPPPPAGKNY